MASFIAMDLPGTTLARRRTTSVTVAGCIPLIIKAISVVAVLLVAAAVGRVMVAGRGSLISKVISVAAVLPVAGTVGPATGRRVSIGATVFAAAIPGLVAVVPIRAAEEVSGVLVALVGSLISTADPVSTGSTAGVRFLPPGRGTAGGNASKHRPVRTRWFTPPDGSSGARLSGGPSLLFGLLRKLSFPPRVRAARRQSAGYSASILDPSYNRRADAAPLLLQCFTPVEAHRIKRIGPCLPAAVESRVDLQSRESTPMTQRELFRLLSAAWAIAAIGAMAAGVRAEEVKRPNVVFLVTDDQGYGDLACHGNTDHQDAEPRQALDAERSLDQFPRRSDLFADAVGPDDRALFLPRRSLAHVMGRSLLRTDEVTMADVFAGSGYRTGIFGKWHLGDNYPYRPQDRGFHEVLTFGGGGIGNTPDVWGNNYFDDTLRHNGQLKKYTGYCTDVFFTAAPGSSSRTRTGRSSPTSPPTRRMRPTTSPTSTASPMSSRACRSHGPTSTA